MDSVLIGRRKISAARRHYEKTPSIPSSRTNPNIDGPREWTGYLPFTLSMPSNWGWTPSGLQNPVL